MKVLVPGAAGLLAALAVASAATAKDFETRDARMWLKPARSAAISSPVKAVKVPRKAQSNGSYTEQLFISNYGPFGRQGHWF